MPGRDAQGVLFAVDFLTAVTKSLLDSQLTDGARTLVEGKNVVIVGSGDTCNDCIGTSIRLGCRSVLALDRNPAPAGAPVGRKSLAPVAPGAQGGLRQPRRPLPSSARAPICTGTWSRSARRTRLAS